ncbi:helix-turn-helix transcriptional regulator [Nitrosomonas supralitoralis]|uniref:Transcriptional regulator, AlpA family n=1 Tax=Nitrosomonas supralitoralis TaxID=2116706 RepID=A0A2P7NRV6_9PROT|nr:AlpA family phage regulatory protein [Nitrosomonas supralitoralis]PSJ16203.1 hypothetical protein C7H79_14720 [Nitrosomonas supralitoralis]
MIENHQNHTLIRLPDLLRLTGLSRSSVYLRLNPKSKYFDEKFPAPVPLSSEIRGGVAWLLSEINLWIESRIQARAEITSIAKKKVT